MCLEDVPVYYVAVMILHIFYTGKEPRRIWMKVPSDCSLAAYLIHKEI